MKSTLMTCVCVVLMCNSTSTGIATVQSVKVSNDSTENVPSLMFPQNATNNEHQTTAVNCITSNNSSQNGSTSSVNYTEKSMDEEKNQQILAKQLNKKLKEIIFFAKPFIIVVGLILNIMGLNVFIVETKSDKSSHFLVCFLSCNTCLLVINTTVYFVYEVKYNNISDEAAEVLTWILKIFMFWLEYAVRSITYSLYAVMSIVSYVAVAFPFHIKRFILSRHPVRTTCILVVVYVIIFSFNMMRFDFKWITNPSTGETTFVPSYTDLARQHMDISNMYGFVGITSTYLIPIPVTVIFFMMTLISMKRSARSSFVTTNDKLRKTKESQTRRLTRIFLILSCIQIIVTLPNTIYITIAKFDEDFKIGGSKVYIGNILFNVFGTLDNIKHGSVAILFFIMSGSFRSAFRKMYLCKKLDVSSENPNTSETTLTRV